MNIKFSFTGIVCLFLFLKTVTSIEYKIINIDQSSTFTGLLYLDLSIFNDFKQRMK